MPTISRVATKPTARTSRKPAEARSAARKAMVTKPVATRKLTAVKPAAGGRAAAKPAAAKPAAGKPTAKKPTAKKPTAKKPTAKKPSVRPTSSVTPAAGRPTRRAQVVALTVEPLAEVISLPAPPRPRRRSRAARAVLPVALGSLTQPGARTGDTCEQCGTERVTSLALVLTDGTPVRFTSCHACEHRSWVGPDGPLDRMTVLDRTRKIR